MNDAQITMTKFGKMGRFGNQVFQLMFLADYAKRHNQDLILPPWVGYQLFTTRFQERAFAKYPVVKELDETPGTTGIFPDERRKGLSRYNFDYEGYAQYHTSYYKDSDREYLKSLFEFVPSVTERLADPVAKLRSMGTTVVGVHLRRGDYGRGMFYITPVAWYLQLLEKIWDNFPNPVLFISTETPALVSEFARFNPQTAETLGVDLQAKPLFNYNYLRYDLKEKSPRQLDWVPDWALLRHCDTLLIPNSTFSFSAAMLRLTGSPGNTFQSNLDDPAHFQAIDPWNAQPLTYVKAENYPHLVDQITVKTNPYWKD